MTNLSCRKRNSASLCERPVKGARMHAVSCLNRLFDLCNLRYLAWRNLNLRLNTRQHSLAKHAESVQDRHFERGEKEKKRGEKRESRKREEKKERRKKRESEGESEEESR